MSDRSTNQPPPGHRYPYYVVLAWDVKAGSQAAADAWSLALRGLDVAQLLDTVVLTGMHGEADRTALFAVLQHVTMKEHPGELDFVMSPLIPSSEDSFWVGRSKADWANVNRIAGVSDPPPLAAPDE